MHGVRRHCDHSSCGLTQSWPSIPMTLRGIDSPDCGDVRDAFHPQAVRASMGAIFRVPLVRTNVTNLRRWTKEHGVQVIGASPDGDVLFNRTHYGARVMLMIGEERRGLTAEQRMLCNQLVRIPMQDHLDSLNAAVAGSLLFYEVLRPAE